MTDLLRQADETPVTLVIAIVYGTLAVVTKMFGPDDVFSEKLREFGWLTPGLVTAGDSWRLLSYAFLHGGIVHLLFNMMALFVIAPQLEKTLGSVRFALLYVVTAIGGGLLVCLTQPFQQPVVGGSAALFGMFGSAVAINMRSGRHAFAFLEFEGPRRLLGLIFVNLLLGLMFPYISNSGHVGGLLTGFAFTLLWLEPGRRRGALLQAWRAASVALFAAALFASLCPVTRLDYLATLAAEATGRRAQQLEQAFGIVSRKH
jgi:membrane associated rhomboid family serine protease